MFDTIGLQISRAEFQGNYLPLLLRLDDVREHKRGEAIAYKGTLHGLYFTIIPPYCCYFRGSLSKAVFGDNLQTLDYKDMKTCIEWLKDATQIATIHKANITRLDIANICHLQHPTTEYTKYFGLYPRAKRIEYGSTLYFQTRDKTLCFYDKGEELKAHGVTPHHPTTANMLRYEYRLKGRLKATFGDAVRLENLYNKRFYCRCISEWLQAWQRLETMPPTDRQQIEQIKASTMPDRTKARAIKEIRKQAQIWSYDNPQIEELRAQITSYAIMYGI